VLVACALNTTTYLRQKTVKVIFQQKGGYLVAGNLNGRRFFAARSVKANARLAKSLRGIQWFLIAPEYFIKMYELFYQVRTWRHHKQKASCHGAWWSTLTASTYDQHHPL
jgi:hypothetical protein